MAITLHMGVVDVAYQEEGKTTTTGDVAQILEEKYDVMGTFYEIHKQDIADEMAKDLGNMLEAVSHGAPMPLGKLTFPKVDHMFQQYLDAGEWERYKGNMPTMAASRGFSHRKKMPFSKKNKARPSFIDTGLYQRSFRAWVDKE